MASELFRPKYKYKLIRLSEHVVPVAWRAVSSSNIVGGYHKASRKKIYRLCDSGSRNIGAVSNYRSNKWAKKKKKRKENGIKQSEM